MYIEKTVKEYAKELAAGSSAPGGGSAAALAGALAASLTSMVCNLTLGRDKFAQYERELTATLKDAEELRQGLLRFVDEDTKAFDQVMEAFKLPKNTPEEQKIRQDSVEKAYVGAAELPLKSCASCLKVMELAEKVLKHGNPNAVCDGVVAVLLAGAGARGAAFNVRTNLKSIKYQDKKQEIEEELDNIISRIQKLEQKLLEGRADG